MGMDVYGLNPRRNTVKPDILIKYMDDEGWTNWDKLRKNNTKDINGNTVYSKEWTDYIEAKEAWDEDNPGRYFRNSVWWWRPLWNYVCLICDDILDEKDHDNGHSNGGHQIDEKKAIAIAERIDLFIKNGDAADYALEREQTLKEAEGVDANYSFDLENLEWFGKFCEQSGGFEIC